MTKILIVEGNSAEILERNRKDGFEFASTCYKNALVLHQPDAAFDMVFPYVPELNTSDQNFSDYDAIALTGSGVSWTAEEQQAKPYMETLAQILKSSVPILGSCWGMQTVAVALGGRCGRNDKGLEAGIAADIHLTRQGKLHPGFAGLDDGFASPCIHRDHVLELPKGAVHLAYNAVSEFQAMSYNHEGIDYFGVQFHPELEVGYINRLLERRGNFPEHEKAVITQPDANDTSIHDPIKRTGILGNWLNHALQTKKAA